MIFYDLNHGRCYDVAQSDKFNISALAKQQTIKQNARTCKGITVDKKKGKKEFFKKVYIVF